MDMWMGRERQVEEWKEEGINGTREGWREEGKGNGKAN